MKLLMEKIRRLRILHYALAFLFLGAMMCALQYILNTSRANSLSTVPLSQQFNLSVIKEKYPLLYQDYRTGQAISLYQTLQDTSNHLKLYWEFFRALVKQTEFQHQIKNVDDGYIATSGILQKLLKQSEMARVEVLTDMSEFVKTEIERIQFPRNCDKAKLLVADLSIQQCGLGCNLHGIIVSLLTAFMTNRTLVLKSEGWRYAIEGWEYAFLPLSSCTYEGNINELPALKERNAKERILAFHTLQDGWMHWSVPSELVSNLTKIHGHPFAWWVGQFTSFALRLRPWLRDEIQNRSQEIGLHDGVVGVQVRWGDKLTREAKKHELEEYMLFVEKWYEQLGNQGIAFNRTVYLASAEKEVWEQLKSRYPKYKFIGLGLEAAWKSKETQRHENLISIVTDLYFLSQCNYLVCTLSSNVCRAAYELMNYRQDASSRFQSVDSPYYFRLSSLKPWVAEMHHEATESEEISFEKGDVIMMDLDPYLPFNDGYLRGLNTRTQEKGKLPAFLVHEIVKSYTKNAFQAAWENPTMFS